MQTFAIIICGFTIFLLMLIGFLMDEVEKWKKIAFNYKKSYETTKKHMLKTYKSLEHIYDNCQNMKYKQAHNTLYGLCMDWRDSDGLKRSTERNQ